METYYKLKLSRGDRVKVTEDISNFEGNRILAKKGQEGVYQGGSNVAAGRILFDGKKKNVKVYYSYLVKV